MLMSERFSFEKITHELLIHVTDIVTIIDFYTTPLVIVVITN